MAVNKAVRERQKRALAVGLAKITIAKENLDAESGDVQPLPQTFEDIPDQDQKGLLEFADGIMDIAEVIFPR